VSEQGAAIERLLAALTARDMATAAAQLHPEIQAHGRRGPFRGIDEVIGWATPNDEGHLMSRVKVDELREIGHFVAVDARRLWCWRENGEVAAEDRFGALFELRDGRIYRWRQDFASIIDAIEAIPAE
jgi:hypothetical protein